MDHHAICTQVWCGVKPENLPPAKFFYSTPNKNGGKTSNFADLSKAKAVELKDDQET